MKRTLIITVLIVATATLALGQTKSTKSASMNSSEKEALIGLEKQAWEAWKTRDGKFFESFLSEESIGVGDSGVAKKAMIVKDIAGPDCEVRSYSFDNYEVVMLDANTAILTCRVRLFIWPAIAHTMSANIRTRTYCSTTLNLFFVTGGQVFDRLLVELQLADLDFPYFLRTCVFGFSNHLRSSPFG